VNWPVERRKGSAQSLHDLQLPGRRGVWVLEVDRPTLVLGSTQTDSVLDANRVVASGVAVARRRSGGGVVGLRPGGSLWVDVVISSADEQWDADVGRSFRWVGAGWQGALIALGARATMVTGPDRHRRWADLVCFAGRNTGEVVVDGAKVVGLSQRRTRAWTRYQCLVLLDADPTLVVDHLRLDEGQRQAMRRDLAEATGAVAFGADELLQSFLGQLD